LRREAIDTGPYSPVRGVQAVLLPIIQEWAGTMLLSFNPSGSFMKGTANRSGTDIDLFISISENTPDTLRELYRKLVARMKAKGYTTTQQNVSVKVRVNGYDVDLVPGKRQDAWGTDHSLYRRKAGTWTKININTHTRHVNDAGRQQESRVLKLWRDQKGLDFPSFYLELTVINALAGTYGTVAANVWKAFQYLTDRFPNARVVDPANTNNIISDDLSDAVKAPHQAHGGSRARCLRLEPDRQVTWSLAQLLASHHADIERRLQIVRDNLGHPTVKGDASAAVWLDLFKTYLPRRYRAETAHVADSNDTFSDQMDLVIFDRQYSPIIFSYEGQMVLPAESLYAVFEVKQAINAAHIDYAQKKIASVRRLHRTSLPVPTPAAPSRPSRLRTSSAAFSPSIVTGIPRLEIRSKTLSHATRTGAWTSVASRCTGYSASMAWQLR
jgi:Domain of unknown function (DUF6602)